MTKEIVTGERIGFNGLSQNLRDVFVHGLEKDPEGRFREVLSAMARDSENVVMTDQGGRFKPKTNEEVFGELVSLTAEAALYEADGKDTHSQDYFDLIYKTDVELTNKLNTFWTNRDRSVEVGTDRVVAKAWGKTSLERIPSHVEGLLEKTDQWLDTSLVDKMVSAYDNGVSKKAFTGLGLATATSVLLTACNAPVAEVQEIAQEVSKPAVVDRQLLNSEEYKKEATQEDIANTLRLLDGLSEIGKNYEGYVSGSETVIAATGENGNEFVWGLFKADNENGDCVWFVGQGVEGVSIDKAGAIEVGSPLLRVQSSDGSVVLGYRDKNNELQPIARKFSDGRYIYFSPLQDTMYEENLGNDSEYQKLENRLGFWQVTTVHAEAIDPTTWMPTQIEPTVAPTEIPKPTVEPTKEVAFYEKNWGNFAKTLDAADVEKNGVIIPYNPIDNPEEFNKIIEEIKKVKDYENGGLGEIRDEEGGGTSPRTARLTIIGMISNPYQIMYFEYNSSYYPFIISNGGKMVLVLDSTANYDEFANIRNKKGEEVSFAINTDPNNEQVSSLLGYGDMSQELYDIAVKTGAGIAFMRQKW